MNMQLGARDMANNAQGRATVAQVAAQQGELEGRVTGLERDMQNMSHAVAQLSEAVNQGFRDTREMMAEAARRQDQRTSEIHKRLDKQTERDRWNPGLVIASITCAILIGGIFVSFVVMTTQPLAKDDLETRAVLEQHVMNDGHPQCMQLHAQEAQELAQHYAHLQQLQAAIENIDEKLLVHADITGYQRAQLEAFKALLETRTSDRFFGREGAAFDARIRAIEEYIRDNPEG